MSSIGGDLNADFLMYGSVTKKGKNYEISVNFLDVHAGKREKTVPTSLPVGTSGVALQTAAKKIYSGLTGQSDSCTITVKTPGVDRATILINGKEAGNITNGVGSVNGLTEGKYSIAIESTGFHRYTKSDVSCTGGETSNIQADMSKLDKVDTKVPPIDTVTNPPGGTGSGSDNHEISGSVSHTKTNPWKYVALGGGVVTVGSAIALVVYRTKLEGLGTDGPDASIWNPGSHCQQIGTNKPTAKPSSGSSDGDCQNADSWSTKSWVAGGATVLFGAVTAFAIYETIHSGDTSSSEHLDASGHRKHHEPFAITPVVSPTGAGATFRMEW